MKLNLLKILNILLIMIFAISIVTNFSLAGFTVTDKFTGDLSEAAEAKKSVEEILSTVLEAVRVAGTAIAIIILIVIGIKIMSAAPSERANIKQYAMNYVIGAIIMIGAVNILSIVKNFADDAIVTKGG